MKKQQKPPERDDLIEVSWVDIYDCPGNPDTAALYRRVSVAYFWEYKDDAGIPSIVTTSTKDADPEQRGFCIYPAAVVTGIRVIKRHRNVRTKTDKPISEKE